MIPENFQANVSLGVSPSVLLVVFLLLLGLAIFFLAR
jgi:hypothetical protein